MADTYRTPDEKRAWAAHEQRVQAVLDQAVADGVSCLVAIELGESAAVVEQWTNRYWDGLRNQLSDNHPIVNIGGHLVPTEDRLCAINLLLADRIQREADRATTVDGAEGGTR